MYHQYEKLESLQINIVKINAISHLINELQQERGLSSGYLASHGKKFKEKLFKKREDVNNALMNNNVKSFLEKEKISIFSVRKQIDIFETSTLNSFNFYTSFIKSLQTKYLSTTTLISDTYLHAQLQSYTNLAFTKEALGQLRGTFSAIFTQKKMQKELLYKSIHSKGMYDISLQRFEAVIFPEILKQFYLITTSENYIYIQKIMTNYLEKNIQIISNNPYTWFQKSTDIINKLYEVENHYLMNINVYIKKKLTEMQLTIFIDTLFFIFTIFILAWLGYILKNDIIRNISLLSEYKNAVDRSSIVSKTDKKGRITYVNDKFCEISGYKKEELLGKPHNIVRHEDVPKAAFREMWKTILLKRPWSGVVKNKKKDGDYYIVEATINPILNHNGEVEEFIAIRNDITEVVKLHEELEHTQEELIFRMGEIGETRSQETGFHVKRVASYSELLARYYGLSSEEITYLKLASPMHDIGKVGIADNILNKPGKLTNDEWQTMKTHTSIGYQLFKDSSKPLLQTAAIIAYEHHEKWDGSGYPRGIKGEEIHVYGRITALADVFDALGSERCYKKAWSDEKIFQLLREERGKHFDPKLVDIFFEHLDEFLELRNIYNDKSDIMQEKAV